MRGTIVLLIFISIGFSVVSGIGDLSKAAGPSPSRNMGSPGTPFWPTPYGPPTLNSTVSYLEEKENLYVEWVLGLPEERDSFTSSPVIDANGYIYVTRGTHLYCIEPNGTMEWQVKVPSSNRSLSEPSICPGTGNIVVSTNLGHIISFGPNGQVNWDMNAVEGDIAPLVPVAFGTSIFYALGDRIGSLDSNGSLVWDRNLSGIEPMFPPSVSGDGSVYFCLDMNLSKFSGEGEENWTLEVQDIIRSPPVIDADGDIWLSTYGKRDVALNLAFSNGTLSWTEELNAAIAPGTPVVLPDGNVSFAPGGYKVYFFEKDGSYRSENFDLYNGGYYYLTPSGEYYLICELELYTGLYEEGPLEIKGVHEKLAFSGDSIYFTKEAVYRLSFSDLRHLSFLYGPIQDVFLEEDTSISLYPYNYFQLPSNEPVRSLEYTMECRDTEGVTITDNYYDRSYKIEPDQDFSGSFSARFIANCTQNKGDPPEEVVATTYSNWFNITILPVNDPPLLAEDSYPFPDAYQNSFYSTTVNVTDVDSDINRMTFSVTDSDIFYMKRNRLEGTVPYGYETGAHYLTLTITDPEGLSSNYDLRIEILEKDEAPRFANIREFTVQEEGELTLDIGHSNYNDITVEDPDGDDDHRYSVEPGPDLTVGQIIRNSFTIRPNVNFFGSTWFDLFVEDNTGIYEQRFTVKVINQKDSVSKLRIVPLVDLTNVTSKDRILLTVDYEDVDNGEFERKVFWTSNLTDEEWSGPVLNTTLEPGIHLITVTMENSFGQFSVTAEMEILVHPPENGGDDKFVTLDDYSGDQWNKWMTTSALVTSIVLAILIIVPVLLLVIKRIRAKKGTEPGPPGPVEMEVKE